MGLVWQPIAQVIEAELAGTAAQAVHRAESGETKQLRVLAALSSLPIDAQWLAALHALCGSTQRHPFDQCALHFLFGLVLPVAVVSALMYTLLSVAPM